MKSGFYSKLAVDGIKKNKKLYFPYFLTCILMVVSCYIIADMSSSSVIAVMEGGANTQLILRFGQIVMSLFAVIFLIYTNSFLVKRRNKEFGLYNILGMNKRNLGKVLFCETFITYVTTMVIGLAIGVILSKFSELALGNLVHGELSYNFNLNTKAIVMTCVIFAIIFVVILLNDLRQVHFSNPVELLRSESFGEKPPKANYVYGIGGIVVLCTAYAIAVSIKQPIAAITLFFWAVLMVIVATYMIFISGSVLLCKILQKSHNFYYKKKNFVAVSSMAYRMKRNGAGLASICILLTMVLVMISSTSTLYFGAEDSARTHYPREISCYICGYGEMAEDIVLAAKNSIETHCDEYGITKKDDISMIDYSIVGYYKNNTVILDAISDTGMLNNMSDAMMLQFIDIGTYNRLTANNETLSGDDIFVCDLTTQNIGDEIDIHTKHYNIVKKIDDKAEILSISGGADLTIVDTLVVVVEDLASVYDSLGELVNNRGGDSLQWAYHEFFDTEVNDSERIALCNAIAGDFTSLANNAGDLVFHEYVEDRESNTDDFYSTFGGLFFVGILLSAVFLIAAVLIIYYKQISEGFEDQSRFEIMKKVGMTGQDIRESINSQMIMVFLLPIIFSALHMAFAFPVISKLLMLFGFMNIKLEMLVTLGCVLVMALFYSVIYKVTSNGYYGIVNDVAVE